MCRQYLLGRLLYPGEVKNKGSVTFGGQTSSVLSDFILSGGSGCTQANKLGDAQMANSISTRACALNCDDSTWLAIWFPGPLLFYSRLDTGPGFYA